MAITYMKGNAWKNAQLDFKLLMDDAGKTIHKITKLAKKKDGSCWEKNVLNFALLHISP